TNLGITLHVAGTRPTGQAANTILHQSPPAGGLIAKGGTVNVTVAAGTETVIVPTLINVPETQALQQISDSGLRFGQRTEAYDPTIPQGNVTHQEPAPGQVVAKGSIVNFT